uniref:MFS transporter n=1 Tax=Gracilinema caldarium TaxID=215591 RepID=A0A7C3HYY1_9SPIR
MKNRWLSLLSGVIIQTILGGVYAWSAFTPWLISSYGLNKAQTGFIYGLIFGVFTIVMVFAGKVLLVVGPQISVIISAILFFSGYFLASLSHGSFLMILLGLGVLTGAAIGFGYICPLSVAMKWFPDKKGLVSGVSLAGFGGGAILLSLIANYFLNKGMDVLYFFRIFGIGAGSLLLISALFLNEPDSVSKTQKKQSSYQGVFTKTFLLAFLGLFSGTFSGLLINGNLIPIALGFGFSMEQAVTAISLFSIGNAFGRIVWGQIFDHIGYKSIPLSLLSLILTSFCLLIPSPAWLLLIVIGLFGFSFGSNFVVYASAVSRYFGVDHFSSLYPVCFLSYGLAGIIGPGFGGLIADVTGSYTISIYVSILILGISFLIVTFNMNSFKNKKLPYDNL